MYAVRKLLGIAATFLLTIPVAHAFIDPPVLEPTNPVAGQVVNLHLRTGICDGVVGGANNPAVSVNGQEIDVLINGVRRTDPILCMFPIVDHVFPIGSFSPGSYTTTVRFRYTPFGLPTVIETLGVLPLDVQGVPAPPSPVPAAGWLALSVLVALLWGVGVLVMRHIVLSAALFLVLLACPQDKLSAQPAPERVRLQVMLAVGPSAPTPEDIVEDWNFSSPPPTASLDVEDPIGAWYLLPIRAEGDFKAKLDANPNAPRAQLERYIVVEYPPGANLTNAINALEADANIEAVSEPIRLTLSSATLTNFTIDPPGPSGAGTTNYGLNAMNIQAAWALAGGYGLVGAVDSGLATNHPELRAFTPGGAFAKGNFLPSYSLDIGRWPSGLDANVDEREPEVVQEPHSSCPTDPNGMAPVDFVGHGTHVAGLIAANAYDGTGVHGACKNCGIGMWRAAYALCLIGVGVVPELNSDAAATAVTLLADTGAQVISQSFGFDPPQADYCAAFPSNPFCLAFAYASPREIVLVGASGNNRNWLQFPARDMRVVAAGGFDEGLLLWNEDRDLPPFHRDDCPFPGFDDECGSNFTLSLGQPKQEVVASAGRVYSSMYPGFNWNLDIGCGDAFGPGASNDGYGDCTGTSMSAPQIAGLLGLLRSVNPLVRVGHPDIASPIGVRNVLASTTFQAQAGQAWSQQLGYGRPDAAAAVGRMLGKVAGATARNRATPLFGLYSSGAKDYAYTTSPNTAIAMLINAAAGAVTTGPTVPGYTAFPPDPMLEPTDIPRANVFIMATEYKISASHPDLTPLYMMERSRHFPVGCNPALPSCNIHNRDFLLATGQGEIEALYAAGYNYRGIQGYAYQRCTPEPGCIPNGAQKLYRKCKTADDDCAVFLENERLTFEAAGYTATFPAGFPNHIGYAYPNADTDGDGLVNGFEYLIGTSPTFADTDGDGQADGVEFPLAAVSTSDPCLGPQADRCPADKIFANGFQP